MRPHDKIDMEASTMSQRAFTAGQLVEVDGKNQRIRLDGGRTKRSSGGELAVFIGNATGQRARVVFPDDGPGEIKQGALRSL